MRRVIFSILLADLFPPNCLTANYNGTCLLAYWAVIVFAELPRVD
jgi:hypothetical protein